MGKIRYFPKQRITLSELKHSQNLHEEIIASVFEAQTPWVEDRIRAGLFFNYNQNDEIPWSLTAQGYDLTLSFDQPFFHGAYNRQFNLFTLYSLETNRDRGWDSTRFTETLTNWPTFTNVIGNPVSSTPGYLNIFLVPKYIGFESYDYISNYLERVITNLAQENRVVDGLNQVVAPYLYCINEESTALLNLIYLYKSDTPMGAHQIPTGIQGGTLTVDLYDYEGEEALIVPTSSVAVFLGSLYFDPIGPAYLTSDYRYVTSKPSVHARSFTYSPSAAGEVVYETGADNFQEAADSIQDLLSGAKNNMNNISNHISGFRDIVLISTEDGDLSVDGYTENVDFPSGIGRRWDK